MKLVLYVYDFNGLMQVKYHDTVNSGIFVRVLFSRNFSYAKFREN